MIVVTLYEAYILYNSIMDVEIFKIIVSGILFLMLVATLIKKDIQALRTGVFYAYLVIIAMFVINTIIVLIDNKVYRVTENVCSERVVELWTSCYSYITN